MTDRKHKRPDADSDSLTLPVLPLRDVVVFPHMVIPLFVGREKSITALELSDAHDKRIFLAAQKDAGMDDPKADDIYTAGTVAHVLQMLKLPDGTVKVLVEGISRASVTEWSQRDGCFMAKLAIPQAAEVDPKEDTVLQRSVLEQFEQYVRGSKKIPPEALTALAEISDSSRLADTIAAHLPVRLPKKQELLEIVDVVPRLEHLLHLLETEIDLLQVEKRMRGRVKRQMEKSQREYYLNEQMRAIQKELGELEDGGNDLDELERRIEAAGPPKAVLAKARSELAKLRMMSPMAAEATVVRNYLDWIVQLPWRTRSRVRRDLDQAQQVLERDHYGLEKVKERILEYLAVQQRVRKLKGPILCLVGPPGVGKTSLGRSIANATGRKFARMSLGGVRDEAEIRGHRRTYIGSLPGKVLQNLAKVGTRNPVFMLDEVDKMAMDFRGDPASALLEVLDPEQNHAFNDHYLEVDYDLSDVLFVATANTLNIPAPLLDRMEVIRLAGYTEDEKLNIATRYLVPKALTDNGLKDTEIAFSDAGAAGHHPAVHPRGGRAESGARDQQGLSQGRAPGGAEDPQGQAADHRQESGRVSGRAALPARPGGHAESDRPGHRAGLDRSRRRTADGGSRRRPGQGRSDAHRTAGRSHAGIGKSGPDRGAQPRVAAGNRRRKLPAERFSPARARGRDTQGRPQCRRRHGHRIDLGTERHSGAGGGGHDRRNHPARRGVGDRRPEGKTAGRTARWDRQGIDSERQ